jgi:hypothetical protein
MLFVMHVWLVRATLWMKPMSPP